MKKSVEELQELLDLKKSLIEIKDDQKLGLRYSGIIESMPSNMADTMPKSIKKMARVLKRISLATLEIAEEELKAVDVEIASYNDAFTNAETK